MKNIKLFKKIVFPFNFHEIISKIEAKGLSVPKDFLNLYSHFRIETLLHIVYHCDFRINVKDINGVLRAISFAKPEKVHLHELDYGEGSLVWHPLIKFAEEDSTEGGIFLSLKEEGVGSIYSFKVDPDRATATDISLIADSLSDLLEAIVLEDKTSDQVFEISNQVVFNNVVSSQIGDDLYWYPWETPGIFFKFPWDEE